jgi:hypothetical protein
MVWPKGGDVLVGLRNLLIFWLLAPIAITGLIGSFHALGWLVQWLAGG